MSHSAGKRRGTSGQQPSHKRSRANSPPGEIVVNPPTLSRVRTRSQLALQQTGPSTAATAATPPNAPTGQASANNSSVMIRDILQAFDRMKQQVLDSTANDDGIQNVLDVLDNMKEDQTELVELIEALDVKYDAEVYPAIKALKNGQIRMDKAVDKLNSQCNRISANQDEILRLLHKVYSKISVEEAFVKKEESAELSVPFQNASDIPEDTGSSLPPSSPDVYNTEDVE